MRTTVQLAYHTDRTDQEQPTQRVIKDSMGRVYIPGEGWVYPRGEVVAERPVYERWADVPAAWCGVVPYFH